MNWIISHIHTVSKHSYKYIYRVWLQCNIIMNRYQNFDIAIFTAKNDVTTLHDTHYCKSPWNPRNLVIKWYFCTTNFLCWLTDTGVLSNKVPYSVVDLYGREYSLSHPCNLKKHKNLYVLLTYTLKHINPYNKYHFTLYKIQLPILSEVLYPPHPLLELYIAPFKIHQTAYSFWDLCPQKS